MSRRTRWSLIGFILSVVAFLSLVTQPLLAYWTERVALGVGILSALLPAAAAMALLPVAARPGRGRAAAIWAIVSVGVMGLGFLVIFTTPKEQGFPFGAGFLILPAYPALLATSLITWLVSRDESS